MTTRPSIAVVVNSYNNNKFIRRAISSVLNQKDQPEQIIIVDDGSTDQSQKTIQEISHELNAQNLAIQTIYTENRGQLSAIFEAVKVCKTDVVCLLDSDDAYSNLHVQLAREYWQKFNFADILYNRSLPISSCGQIQPDQNRSDEQDVLLGPVRQDQVYDHGYCAILAYHDPWYYSGNRTSCLSFSLKHLKTLQLDKYIEKFRKIKHHADLILILLSALTLGRKIYWPEHTVLYRQHEMQITPKTDLEAKYKWDVTNHIIRQEIRRQFQAFENSHLIADKELATVPKPTKKHIRAYQNLVCKSNHARNQRVNLIKTTSWKITRPMRAIAKYVIYPLIGKKYNDLDIQNKSVSTMASANT